MFHVNNSRSITPSKFPSVTLNVWIVKEYSYYIRSPTKYNSHIPRSWNRFPMTNSCYVTTNTIMNHLSHLDFIEDDNLMLVTSNFEEAHSIVTNLKWSPSTKPKKNTNINHIDHCFELVTFQCETCINLVFVLRTGI